MMPSIKSTSVAIFVLKPEAQETKVLLLRRKGYLSGLWCPIVGGIEPGEAAWQAAMRETREETGLSIRKLWSADLCIPTYRTDKDCICLVPVFVGSVSKDAEVTLNDEHDAFDWMSFGRADSVLSLPRQRCALSSIKAEFVDREPNMHLKIAMNGEDRRDTLAC